VELKEALGIALEHEHKVRDHYAAGADSILDSRGRKVFATLAREEGGHVAYLESRLAEWVKDGKIQTPDLPTILPGTDWIAQAHQRVTRAPAPTIAVQSELDLLKVALDLERRASGFYGQLVNTLGAEYRPLFARFLEIENGHLAIVQAEIDAISGTGTWFDVMEIDLEAG
jgi:rubrerythrin